MGRNASIIAFLSTACCAAVLAACGESPVGVTAGQSRPSFPTPTPVGAQTPGNGNIYLGAYVAGTLGGASALENSIGRKLALNMHYYPFNALFPNFQENADLSAGRLSVDSWDCEPSNAQIVAGDADLLISTRAQAIKNYGHAVFLRYMWDMNLPKAALGRNQCWDPATDNPDNTFSATEYVGAWLHIRQIFTQMNVTNVVWVWNVSSAGVDPTPYFPGASQVDWVGVDAYDTSGDPNFADTLSAIYPTLAKFGKPILVGETGASALIQPAYLQSVAGALKSQFPLVKGFMYYDGNAPPNSWVLTSAGGVQAFATLGKDPYFAAFGIP